MVLVVGRIVLPHVPVAKRVGGHEDSHAGKVALFVPQLLAHVHIVVLLPKDQQRGEHHDLIKSQLGHQVYICQVPEHECIFLNLQYLVTLFKSQSLELSKVGKLRQQLL